MHSWMNSDQFLGRDHRSNPNQFSFSFLSSRSAFGSRQLFACCPYGSTISGVNLPRGWWGSNISLSFKLSLVSAPTSKVIPTTSLLFALNLLSLASLQHSLISSHWSASHDEFPTTWSQIGFPDYQYATWSHSNPPMSATTVLLPSDILVRYM